ncbi:hypothetical protein SAMD00024442_1_91 [Candidatus Symbiothrix dinenymphae]|nr:hypothetical protein SAMD00024442_1_91 [Candidatus Symbiothrix dinenymphae]
MAAGVLSGTSVSKPHTPISPIKHKIFLAWCTDPALTTEWNFTNPVTTDMDLYAKWKTVYTILAEDFEKVDANWIVINGTQTNKWMIGANAADNDSKVIYISDNNKDNRYKTDAQSVTHFYRDVHMPKIFPAGAKLYISFEWKGMGQKNVTAAKLVDYLSVRIQDAPPVAGTVPLKTAANQPLRELNDAYSWREEKGEYDLAAYFGNNAARKLVFTWANDDELGAQPPVAIDNIAVYTDSIPVTVVFVVTSDNQFASTVAYGTPVRQPANPSREGYTFRGWRADNSARDWNFDDPVEPTPTLPLTMTLTAQWSGGPPATEVEIVEPMDDIQIYPNPADEEVTVTNALGNTVTIISSQGRTMYSKVAKSNEERIVLSSWAAGIYIVKVSSEKGAIRSTLKLIKE